MNESDEPAATSDLNTESDERADVRITAKAIDQWYWAASHAGIPQVWDIEVESSVDLPKARVTATLRDGSETIASAIALEGPLSSGRTGPLPPVLLNLSPGYMVGVDERRPAQLALQVEALDGDEPAEVAAFSMDIDVMPRDLFAWSGNPRIDIARREVNVYLDSMTIDTEDFNSEEFFAQAPEDVRKNVDYIVQQGTVGFSPTGEFRPAKPSRGRQDRP